MIVQAPFQHLLLQSHQLPLRPWLKQPDRAVRRSGALLPANESWIGGGAIKKKKKKEMCYYLLHTNRIACLMDCAQDRYAPTSEAADLCLLFRWPVYHLPSALRGWDKMTLERLVIAAKASLPPSGKMILYTEIVFRSDVSFFLFQSN